MAADDCPDGDGEKFTASMVVGIVLSVVADAIISVSLNVTKYAHNINHDPATNKPKKPYIKLPLWWLGIILNAGGELGNLFAYATPKSHAQVKPLVRVLARVCDHTHTQTHARKDLRMRASPSTTTNPSLHLLSTLSVQDNRRCLRIYDYMRADAPAPLPSITLAALLPAPSSPSHQPRHSLSQPPTLPLTCSLSHSLACSGAATASRPRRSSRRLAPSASSATPSSP
eukprot:1086883-Pleurochrysis_carterae.AAC.4